MNENKERKIYKAPQAQDLSGFGALAKGVGPQGGCKAGDVPYFTCVAGPAYVSTCATGAGVDTSLCSIGGYHFVASCNYGAVAATICISGAHQQ
jgi:hypothetical protein